MLATPKHAGVCTLTFIGALHGDSIHGGKTLRHGPACARERDTRKLCLTQQCTGVSLKATKGHVVKIRKHEAYWENT